MNKTTFIEQLKQGLKKHNINDIDDIVSDYENYFVEQLKNGKSEEDISFRLGDVKSIIRDYAESSSASNKRWFDLVTIGFVAIPVIIMLYGVLIVFIGSTVATWAIAIYYLFRLETFSFMPMIPMGVHLIYVLLMLCWSVFFFTLSVRMAKTLKSMTMQYLVKQTIRIGEYHIKPIYVKLFNYSLMIGLGLFVVGYAVSAFVAKSFEYWHVWGWFQ